MAQLGPEPESTLRTYINVMRRDSPERQRLKALVHADTLTASVFEAAGQRKLQRPGDHETLHLEAGRTRPRIPYPTSPSGLIETIDVLGSQACQPGETARLHEELRHAVGHGVEPTDHDPASVERLIVPSWSAT
jgi:hypothetical protein